MSALSVTNGETSAPLLPPANLSPPYLPMYHAIKHCPEGLEEKARAAAILLGAEKQAAIRRSYTSILARLLEKELAHTLTEKGLAGLEFMKAANKDCSTAAALVEYLLLTWMLTAKARHSGLLTLKMEAAANMVEGVFMFAGIKLKVTH